MTFIRLQLLIITCGASAVHENPGSTNAAGAVGMTTEPLVRKETRNGQPSELDVPWEPVRKRRRSEERGRDHVVSELDAQGVTRSMPAERVAINASIGMNMSGVALARINNLFMIWLPTHPFSKHRIQRSVCRTWPPELKDKLVLIDGVNAHDFNEQVSHILQTALARRVLGSSSPDSPRFKAVDMVVDEPSTKAGAVALFLGHMAAWQRVAEGPSEGWTIVLEDDAQILPARRHLAALEELRAPIEASEPTLVMLDPRKMLGVEPTTGKCRSCIWGCGSAAYAIDQKAARHLLKKADLTHVVDMYLELAIKTVCPFGPSPIFTELWNDPSMIRRHGSDGSPGRSSLASAVIAQTSSGTDQSSDVNVRICSSM